MSISAINSTLKLKLERSSCKFVLLCLANYANEENYAYPSIARLEEDTCMDRKTIINAIGWLIDKGLISDSGRRVGKTLQIPVYQLNLNSPENGTVPFFPIKQSQKRDTEPSLEPPDINTHTKPDKEPDKFDEFWKEYPSKQSKKAAIKAYRNAIKNGATHEDIISGVRKFKSAIESGYYGRDYTVKFAQGWLNDSRWCDEYTPRNSGQPTQGASYQRQEPRDVTSAVLRACENRNKAKMESFL